MNIAVDQILASEDAAAAGSTTGAVLWGLADHQGTIRDVVGNVSLGAVNSGIAAQDNATGSGFILYSVESVFTRFSTNPPYPGNSDHLIAVKYMGGQWYYDNNTSYVAFTPRSSDVLIASVDFSNDTITGLQGVNGKEQGIVKGYLVGDLTFAANMFAGTSNPGEFTVGGTYFIRNDQQPDHRQYDSFGNITAETAAATDFIFGYTGQALDKETGLLDFGHRWYDAAVGQLLSEDPFGYFAGDMNLYRYVFNDPFNNTDPSGLCSKSVNNWWNSYSSTITSAASNFAWSNLSLASSAYSSAVSTLSSINVSSAWDRTRIGISNVNYDIQQSARFSSNLSGASSLSQAITDIVMPLTPQDTYNMIVNAGPHNGEGGSLALNTGLTQTFLDQTVAFNPKSIVLSTSSAGLKDSFGRPAPTIPDTKIVNNYKEVVAPPGTRVSVIMTKGHAGNAQGAYVGSTYIDTSNAATVAEYWANEKNNNLTTNAVFFVSSCNLGNWTRMDNEGTGTSSMAQIMANASGHFVITPGGYAQGQFSVPKGVNLWNESISPPHTDEFMFPGGYDYYGKAPNGTTIKEPEDDRIKKAYNSMNNRYYLTFPSKK